LHRNGADSRESGVLSRNPSRNRRAQVYRYPVVFGVQGVLVAGCGDQLAHMQILRTGADLDDDTTQRVAEWSVGIEPVHDLLVGGDRALLGY